MSEYAYGRPEEGYKPEQASLGSIKRFLENWINNPTGNDKMISRFSEAAVFLLESDERFRQLIEETIEFRNSHKKDEDPTLDADYASNLLLRDIQFQFLSMDKLREAGIAGYEDFYYPDRRFETTSGWLEGLDRVLSARLEELKGTLFFEKIVSNVSDRYKAFKIILPRYTYRFNNQPLKVLDVGPSVGLGPKKLLLNEPFNPVNVSIASTSDEGIHFPDPYLASGVNVSINKPLDIETIVGFDSSISDNHVERVRAHSFYPGELYRFSQPHDKPNRLDEFNRLVQQEVPGYQTFKGDFTSKEDINRFKETYPDMKFHAVTWFTVGYMFSDEEVATALQHSKDLLLPGGIIFISDRVKADPKSPNGLRFGGQWNQEWIYTGVVIDPQDGGIPQEHFRWRTPRCQDLVFLRHV